MNVISSTNVSSIYPDFFACYSSTTGSVTLGVFTFTNVIMLIPLYILILYMGFQKWQLQHTATSISHSDVFTYNMVIMEIIGIVGSICFFGSIYSASPLTMRVGLYLICLTYAAQTYFHALTCVERYLAVVHPITFMRLRQAGGIQIRNISIGCVYLLCIGWLVVMHVYYPGFPSVLLTVTFSFSFIIVSFCSFSILCVLIGLGLGKVGRSREQTDQIKLRAFYTVMAILGVLTLRCCALVATNFMIHFGLALGDSGCVAIYLGLWLCVPSSLVLPLLFLHKSGKLSCCGHNPKNQTKN